MLEQWAAGVGMEMCLETVLKRTKECTQWDSKEKAKEKENVITLDRREFFPESAPISRKAKARAKDSKESVTIAARKAIPPEGAPKSNKEESQKEREMATKETAKDRGTGARAFGK